MAKLQKVVIHEWREQKTIETCIKDFFIECLSSARNKENEEMKEAVGISWENMKKSFPNLIQQLMNYGVKLGDTFYPSGKFIDIQHNNIVKIDFLLAVNDVWHQEVELSPSLWNKLVKNINLVIAADGSLTFSKISEKEEFQVQDAELAEILVGRGVIRNVYREIMPKSTMLVKATCEISATGEREPLFNQPTLYEFLSNIGAVKSINTILSRTSSEGLNYKDSDGKGFIHWTMNLPDCKGKEKFITNLKDRINEVDSDGKTPMHYLSHGYSSKTEAAMSVRFIEHMLNEGADLNIRDGLGFTPLTILGKDCSNEVQFTFRDKHEGIRHKYGAVVKNCLSALVNKNKEVDVEQLDDQSGQPVAHWLLETHGNNPEFDCMFSFLKAKNYDFTAKNCTRDMDVMSQAILYEWPNAIKGLGKEGGVTVTQEHSDQAYSVGGDVYEALLHSISTELVSEEVCTGGAVGGNEFTDDFYN